MAASESDRPTMKRPRKQNWSEAEVFLLLDNVEHHYDKLFGRFSANLTYREKRDLWEKIAEAFTNRNAEELKHKFQKLKSEKITEYNGYLKRVKATGGGPQPKPLSNVTERVIAIIGFSNPKISGLEGGIDTAHCGEVPSTSVQSSASSLDLRHGEDETTPRKKAPTTSQRRNLSSNSKRTLVDVQVHENLNKQHELIIGKIKKEHELLDLQLQVARLQLQNEETRKQILNKKLNREESDRYAFLE